MAKKDQDTSVRPYDGFGASELDRAFVDWREHGPAQVITRQYLLDSFYRSEIVDRPTRDSVRRFDFRLSHARLLEQLLSAGDQVSRRSLFALIRTASHGYPLPLAETLLRFLAAVPDDLIDRAQYAETILLLGELPLEKEKWVDDVLEQFLQHPDGLARSAALVGLYRRAVFGRGPCAQGRTAFADVLEPRLALLALHEQVLVLLTTGGLVTGGQIVAGTDLLEAELRAIIKRSLETIPTAFPSSRMKTVRGALNNGDFCTAAVSVGLDGLEQQESPACEVLDAVVCGAICPSRHPDVRPQAILNSAIACLQTGHQGRARLLAEEVWINAAHHSPGLLIAALEVLIQAGHVQPRQAERAIDWLGEAYYLSTDDVERLGKLREAAAEAATKR